MKNPGLSYLATLILLVCMISCRERSYLTVDGIKVPIEIINSAKENSFDYTGKLAKAINRDEQSLSDLLSFSQKTESTDTDKHGKVLLDILSVTGDTFFSKCLVKLNDADKRIVWSTIDNASIDKVQAISQYAPLTFKVLNPAPQILEYEGLYIPKDKLTEILLCEQPDARFTIVDEKGELGRNYNKITGSTNARQSIYFRAKGYVASYYGSRTLPEYCDGFFVLTELIRFEKKNFRNTCIPYEVWAIGNEPFWQVMVSEREGVFEFLVIGEEQKKVFEYVAPIENDTLLTYGAFDEDSGDNIRIVVEKKPCQDGMTNRKYEYEVKLTINGRRFQGCGFSFASRHLPSE